MAVLARVNYLSQGRVDLHDVLAGESFLAQDVRLFSQIFSGVKKNYVIRGLEVKNTSALIISIGVADTIVLCPADNSTSFYVALSDDLDQQIALPPSTTNIYIEAYFSQITQSSVSRAAWDPAAISGDSPAGSEFVGPADFQEVVKLNFRVTTTGFSSDAIPVARATTNTSGVTNLIDARELFYRLGTGGANPDPNSKFEWSGDRRESLTVGTSAALGTLTNENPYFYQDANGARNDKALRSLKEWMDAMMTIIAEIKGTPFWYTKRAEDTNLDTLAFDAANGHAVVPQADTTVQWSKASDNKLRTDGVGPISWKANFGQIQWNLGGTFLSSSNRSFDSKLFEKSITDGCSLYLRLERETTPLGASGAQVKWAQESLGGQPIANCVSGVAGDFTGVAVGDYIRKDSDGYFRYVKVTGFFDSIVVSTDGQIATSAATGLIVNTAVTASTEAFKWFRANYSADDLFVSSLDGMTATNNGATYTNVDSVSFHWLGRRNGSLFHLRNYGNLSAGEEILSLDDSSVASEQASGNLFLLTDRKATLSTLGVYSTASVSGSLLKVNKRKQENLIESGGANNPSGWLSYSVPFSNAITFSADGDGLWVKINEDAPGVLSVIPSGNIDLSSSTNIYQVLPATYNPLRNYDNRNIHLVCRRATINGKVCIQFADGTIITDIGAYTQIDISKVITTIMTSASIQTPVLHGFLSQTKNFTWSALDETNNRSVVISAAHTDTGLLLEPTPAGPMQLRVVFLREVS